MVSFQTLNLLLATNMFIECNPSMGTHLKITEDMKERFRDVQWLDANLGAPPSDTPLTTESSPSNELSPPSSSGPGTTNETDVANPSTSKDKSQVQEHPDSDSDDELAYEVGEVSIMEYGFDGGRLSTFTPNVDQFGLRVALNVFRERGHYKEVYFVSIYTSVYVYAY